MTSIPKKKQRSALHHLSESDVQAICDKHIVANTIVGNPDANDYQTLPLIESITFHSDAVFL